MTQTSILAPASTAGTSTDIVVAAGAVVTVGIYAAAENSRLPLGVHFSIKADTPGGDNELHDAALRQNSRQTVLAGPGTYRVSRPDYTGTGFGVYIES